MIFSITDGAGFYLETELFKKNAGVSFPRSMSGLSVRAVVGGRAAQIKGSAAGIAGNGSKLDLAQLPRRAGRGLPRSSGSDSRQGFDAETS